MEVRLTILWGSSATQENFAAATLLDVSAQGAKFRVSAQIPRGAWLAFNSPSLGIGGRGAVRYCNLSKGQYEVGVELPNGTGWDASKDLSRDLRHLAAALAPEPPPQLERVAPDQAEVPCKEST